MGRFIRDALSEIDTEDLSAAVLERLHFFPQENPVEATMAVLIDLFS